MSEERKSIRLLKGAVEKVNEQLKSTEEHINRLEKGLEEEYNIQHRLIDDRTQLLRDIERLENE